MKQHPTAIDVDGIHRAADASSDEIGSFGTPIVHVGFGPYFAQNPAPNFAPFVSSHVTGIGTPVGCAEQYGRLPGLAKYCWW